MLLELNVKDIALIRKASVCFGSGLNVMTGETGTGKSMIIDSCLLALGNRLRGDVIREGSDEANIQLVFDLKENPGESESAKLKELDISPDDNGTVIISRKITRQRSISRINDEVVTASKLSKLASLIIDIYGQQESHTLMDVSKHLSILDEYLGEEIREELAHVKSAWEDFRKASEALKTFDMDEAERLRECERLEFELVEIERANIREGEEEELSSSLRRMSNSKNILDDLSLAHGLLENSALEKAALSLEHAVNYDDGLKDIYDELIDAQSVISDAIKSINEYAFNLEVDEEKLAQTEERLDLIRSLEAKYGKTPEDIRIYQDKIAVRLMELKHYEENKIQAIKDLDTKKSKLLEGCKALSTKRKKGAVEFGKLVSDEINDLGFEKAVFCVEFKEKAYSGKGFDEVMFIASLNPGESMKPINEAASGGELSRIMLAIKTVLAGSDTIPTLIFDEIDTGISGRTAQKVAEKLDRISMTHQVICVTHLPQIAAFADDHFVIDKKAESNGRNITSIRHLSEDGAIEELARLLGGTKITPLVKENAAEMRALAMKEKSLRRKEIG